jgi:hypothetical protein
MLRYEYFHGVTRERLGDELSDEGMAGGEEMDATVEDGAALIARGAAATTDAGLFDDDDGGRCG